MKESEDTTCSLNLVEENQSFEIVLMKDASEVEDHKIEIIGPDIDTVTDVPGRMPLAVIVKIAGKTVQTDFEPVLEEEFTTS